MKLAELSVRRHVLAFMASAVFVLFGLVAYQRIGVDRFPRIEFPVISITTVLAGANQEHGIVSRMDGKVDPDMATRLSIGRRLRILPNHACATGAQFSEYQAITAHGVAQQWRRFDGW